jgi:hypothetical protein
MQTSAAPRLVTVGDTAGASGIAYKKLWKKTYQGDRRPAGGQRPPQFSVPQVLALRVGRILEARFGLTVPQFADLFNLLWNADERELASMFAAGRESALLVGNTVCGLKLFTAAEISNNHFFDVAAAKEAGFPLPVGVNVAKEYAAVISHLNLDGDV